MSRLHFFRALGKAETGTLTICGYRGWLLVGYPTGNFLFKTNKGRTFSATLASEKVTCSRCKSILRKE